MLTVGTRRALAARDPSGERDGGVGEIHHRQGGGRRQPDETGARDQDQQEAEQVSDRDAADIAEKDPRRVPVPDQEPDRRRRQRHRRTGHGRRRQTERREPGQPDPDRHRLGTGDAVDAIHEVVEVDEPQPAKRRQRQIDPRRRDRGERPPPVQGPQPGRDRQRLHAEPQAGAEAAQIVGEGDGGQRQRRTQRNQPSGKVDCRQGRHRQPDPGGGHRRHHRDAAATRYRHRVARALVRPVENGPAGQHADQARVPRHATRKARTGATRAEYATMTALIPERPERR